MNPISQRDAFWSRIYDLARKDRNIVVVSADMGAPALDRFRTDLRQQFVNAGIAEQNAILVASGLALTGKKVFAYAIGPFITLRCIEQIRVENAAMKIPVTIVGVGAGFSYEDSGPTHHLLEDLAMMRAMPITVHNITDPVMAASVADISCRMKTANYVRLDRLCHETLYSPDTDFSAGLETLRDATDYFFVSTGNMTHVALDVAGDMEKNRGLRVGVIDVYTLPINARRLLDAVASAQKLITLEEHFLAGGFGSAVLEILHDHNHLIPVKRLGLPTEKGYCYRYGGRDVMRGYYGVDRDGICKAAAAYFVGAAVKPVRVTVS